ncbi:MAG: nuclear transport factor 2 family protein [Actinomycetota bacterium]|nr:nuclear transport factor 2 family protein [Actinomycetota bacterium]
MSADSADLVRRGMDAFNQGDLQTILAMLDYDVEVFSHPDTGNPGSYRGHDGYLQWAASWLEAWDDFRVEVREVEALDDEHVIAVTDQFARGKGSGVEVSRRGVTFAFTLHEGRATRLGLYLDREAALADLRLER